MIQEFFEFWRKVRCPRPECVATNWVYDSHSQRAYPEIHDAVKCHRCGNLFWCGDIDDLRIRLEVTSDDALQLASHCEGRVNPGHDTLFFETPPVAPADAVDEIRKAVERLVDQVRETIKK